MNTDQKPYFLQTSQWSQFWLESAAASHHVHYISHKSQDVELSAYLYQYPWYLGKSFLYIPKGPLFKIKNDLTKEQLTQEYKIFLTKIIEFAVQNKQVFIKLDFDYNITDLLYLHDNSSLSELIKNFTNKVVRISKKSLQYLSTMILDCGKLQKDDDPSKFIASNSDFWSRTNENIRRYTRKSLKQNWTVDTSKTSQNFEDFWQVYQSTAHRQDFAIHPKCYFQAMFAKDFVRIIVLKDELGKPHCCWFGVVLEGTLYYLYGGNDEYSFSHQGQYLAHLVALQIAANEEIYSYDLGGYDPEKGFGKFKEGYRGKIVQFLGPIDIVLQPTAYTAVNTMIEIGRKLKKY
jgi:lipid II:glycine glycyltransferase (peptidoglycan interpeptide bridge formation enzyme)